ncbi:TIGR03557 family F420-dependent LLM class oxidoreductase [Halocatena marina]|uniref:TIGR03557 family F420-dependent LLM class oxidoreductase n=1 Tax=Halocatena marina TaxID=2934937 RepID=A0ABD5YVV0_9EURY|nr:TIGR03557 family F420-dependent LLM class oxidoreductase [Halocatena marina]
MTEIGYTLSSEEHGPNALVRQAQRAEAAGFDFASISDHYHPWISQQGHSPFVWSTLGAIAHATDELDIGIGVSCPTMRIHPAIIAQAAATTATMLPDRFFFGVGTGEKLNEHILGDHWPPHSVRLEMLEEAIEIIRTLWEGGQTSYYGEYYTVENARLFTLPEDLPPIIVSAFGDRTAAAAGQMGDGFWAVGPQGDLLDTYEAAGGDGPTYTQLHLCYAETEEEAIQTAHKHWPQSALPGELGSLLPTPTHFEQAVQMVSEEDIANGSIITDPDPEAHLDAIEAAFDAGYDHVYVHQIGPEQASFFQFYEENILPEVT